MHDNMIINMSGWAGKCMGVDMEIEHLIKLDKVCTLVDTTHCTNELFQFLFISRGIHGNWDCLRNLSAICTLLSFFKKHCNVELESQYSGSSHTCPDTSSYIWTIVEKACDQRLNYYVANCQGSDVLDAIKKVINSSGDQHSNHSTERLYSRLHDIRIPPTCWHWLKVLRRT